jgi:hypothetical protein
LKFVIVGGGLFLDVCRRASFEKRDLCKLPTG